MFFGRARCRGPAPFERRRVPLERPGAAIISETAGVAAEMGPSALLVSPLDIEGTAEAMGWALDMPMAEREARLVRLRRQAESWTAGHWLAAQLEALNLAQSAQVNAPLGESPISTQVPV